MLTASEKSHPLRRVRFRDQDSLDYVIAIIGGALATTARMQADVIPGRSSVRTRVRRDIPLFVTKSARFWRCSEV
jgi:hypothetical protein